MSIDERVARLTESIAVLRKLWSGETASHHGRFFAFEDVRMLPPPRQVGGPPILCGGRSEPALRRTGQLADGWLSYVVTPEIYASNLAKITLAATAAGRTLTRFGTGDLLFARLDDSYEKALDTATETLSVRYAMDFRQAARRYAALGTQAQVAERIRAFHAAGARHIDLGGTLFVRAEQVDDVLPLLADLRG